MDIQKYKALTNKKPIQTKPRTRPLPKATNRYLDAEEEIERTLQILEIKYEKKFQFKSTKHWRFDFHLVEHRILIEISGGPWSGGRGGKLATKAWSMDRYDVAAEMGYSVVRLESARSYKIKEDGPLQVQACFAVQWLKNLKRHSFNETKNT
ncbi:hypothetical protein [Acinetobacter rudis]|uniref:DUF559 domain-containing protein n=1 Tax=Acinetobacter rudis CIP 110305 TaxID=421052 RepID=S3NL52_9GAMM|nr:hypothetical protein [Acinetobacter rudis]EPF74994.1 hypothetical protein F945_01365 [Acinetobacter rudis CIP 110305]